MKNFYRTAAIVVTLMLMTSVSAFAFPYLAGDYNGIFFRNAEVFVDNDGSNDISVGDVFWGVMSVQNIVAPTDLFGQTGPNYWRTGDVPTEITGYFAQKVVNVVDTGIVTPDGNLFNLYFGPAGADDPNKLVAGNEAILIYEDAVENYNDASQASGLSTATDGTFSFSLGFGNAGDYWYTPLVLNDPFIVGDVGESYAGLSFIQNPLLVSLVNDPNESEFDSDVEFWFNSEIFGLGTYGTVNQNSKFHFGSNDPAVYYPVPEPSTFMLLGAGLLGFLVVGRKKKRNQ